MRAKTGSPASVNKAFLRDGAEPEHEPESGGAPTFINDAEGAAAPSSPPTFDSTPLEDLRAVMEEGKFVTLIGQLVQGLEGRIGRLTKLLDGSSRAEAAQEAHDIVSVAGNVGAARLSALARQLELAFKSGDEAGCRSLSPHFVSEAADALRALKNYRTAA